MLVLLMPCSSRTASNLVQMDESTRLCLVVARRLLGIAGIELNVSTELFTFKCYCIIFLTAAVHHPHTRLGSVLSYGNDKREFASNARCTYAVLIAEEEEEGGGTKPRYCRAK